MTQERKIDVSVLDMLEIGFCPLKESHQLRGRIIFPIRDVYGNLLAISTRHIDKDDPNRFWHESFDKGSNLYGMYYILQRKNRIMKNSKYIVVEGEIDLASLLSNGFKYVVALCGSAFTYAQARILSGRTSQVFLMLDGDAAGRKATERAMKMYHKKGLDAYDIEYVPVYLPYNYDPDDYIKKCGKKKMIKLLKDSYENKECYSG